jgi:hypothetical protein
MDVNKFANGTYYNMLLLFNCLNIDYEYTIMLKLFLPQPGSDFKVNC